MADIEQREETAYKASAETERMLYNILSNHYTFPDFVVVWREDKERGGDGNNPEDWYYTKAPFDFIIYLNEPENSEEHIIKEMPTPGNASEARQAWKLLREKSGAEPITIELKNRDITTDFRSLFLNNHIDWRQEQNYFSRTTNYNKGIPSKDVPVSDKGKLNKIKEHLRANHNRPFYFINRKNGTKQFYVVLITPELVRYLESQDPSFTYYKNPIRRRDTKARDVIWGEGDDRWERNYEIFWSDIALLDNNNPELSLMFNNGKPVSPVRNQPRLVGAEHFQKPPHYVGETEYKYSKYVIGDLYQYKEFPKDKWVVVKDDDPRLSGAYKHNEETINRWKREIAEARHSRANAQNEQPDLLEHISRTPGHTNNRRNR